MKPWKVQKFASDVVYDLRSRNLLLVAVLLIVAIVAVPIMIARSSSSSEPAPAPSLAAATGADTAENQSAVVSYSPAGVRAYKRRLNDLAAKDPFKQQFTGPGAADASTLDQAAAAVGGSSGGTGLQATDIIGVGGDTGTETGSSGGSGGGGGTKTVTKTKTKTKYFSYATDVQVGESGGTLATLTRIPQFSFLPSQQVPVLVFLGTSSGGSQAIFMVAKDVVSVGGEGLCYPSPDSCQLLALSAGKGADLIYGVDHKTYHVQVTAIKRVTSSKPPS